MKKLLGELKKENYRKLEENIISEKDLNSLGNIITKDFDEESIVKNLIVKIPESNKFFDWNVGSIIQHVNVQIIIKIMKEINPSLFFNSIGLAWAFGEFNNTNQIIVDFLYEVIENTTNSEAWWRAAFSIEALGLEEAVNLLKRSLKTESLKDIDYYLDNIDDKKSIISILILSNVDNIQQKIYPRIKKIFMETENDQIIINCCWLLGRLKLIDQEIYKKLFSLISNKNYELRYYIFFALQNNATESMRPILEKALKDKDPLIRKMAVRGLMSIGNKRSLPDIEEALYVEEEESVIGELSKTIYHLKNPTDHTKLLLKIKAYKNENGMISDESDKWYGDPSIYQIFSEAEDPENICFSVIQEKIKEMDIKNPIDIATGTGRMLWQIIDKISFSGFLYAVDSSKEMCSFLSKKIKIERKFTSNIKIINTTIEQFPQSFSLKSNFIISSFGFPSKISNKELCLKELIAIHSILDDDGIFFTIGWDETFNDELNRMWFKFIPDKIMALHFEEWRKKRAMTISSARNCYLKWIKKGIIVPLQFSSLKDSACVMGYLFGRDAAEEIINSFKTEWSMRLGITCNTKKEISQIIEKYERS